MSLPISQITSAALQKLAYLKDRNNDGVLQEDEFKNFKSEAAKRKDISDEDFNQAMGLYITKPENNEPSKVDVTKPQAKKEEVVLETNDEEVVEEFMPVAESVTSDGKTTYKIKLGDTWASLAEKFGFTKEFPTMKEAIHAIKEVAGYGSKLSAAEMPKEIRIDKEAAGTGSKLNPNEM